MLLAPVILSDSDRAILVARLTEAENARHEVLTGGNINRIRHGDRDIGFSQADLKALDAYINELRAQLGLPLMQISRTLWRRPRWGR